MRRIREKSQSENLKSLANLYLGRSDRVRSDNESLHRQLPNGVRGAQDTT